ncbi:MAG: prepilin-type N-terminal cleavage/methylation domain-containing protein [Candidatus Zixiibacteriota bacterium]
MNISSRKNGYTIVEMLIAMFLTGIVALASYNFYIRLHNSAITQDNITEMQQNSRNTLQEICKNVRMAGFKIGSHAPYSINGDSLYIFFSQTQPVDTILYYLENYTGGELSWISSLPEDQRPQKLMKKVNSNQAEVFSDYVRNLRFTVTGPASLSISLLVQVPQADEDYYLNDGVRNLAQTENITIRNLNL